MSLPCLKSSEFPLALRTSFECLVCCTEHPSSPPPLPPPHPSSLCAGLQTTLLAGQSGWVFLSPFYLATPLQPPPGSFPRLHFVHLVWGLPQGIHLTPLKSCLCAHLNLSRAGAVLSLCSSALRAVRTNQSALYPLSAIFLPFFLLRLRQRPQF